MKIKALQAWTTRDGKRRRIRLFEAYCNMLGRCRGAKSKDAGKYWNAGNEFGGWDEFRAWALRNGYRKGVQLDRRVGTQPYSPTNCQWLSASEHGRKGSDTHRPGCSCRFCLRKAGMKRVHTARSTAVLHEASDVPF